MSDTPVTSPKPVSRFATILKGETVSVLLLDDTRLDLFIRQMPARYMMEKFMQHLIAGREWQLIEDVCKNIPGQPELEPGWSDALSVEAHIFLLERAKAINFSIGVAQVARSKAMVDEFQPLEKALTERSPSSSPTPP